MEAKVPGEGRGLGPGGSRSAGGGTRRVQRDPRPPGGWTGGTLRLPVAGHTGPAPPGWSPQTLRTLTVEENPLGVSGHGAPVGLSCVCTVGPGAEWGPTPPRGPYLGGPAAGHSPGTAKPPGGPALSAALPCGTEPPPTWQVPGNRISTMSPSEGMGDSQLAGTGHGRPPGHFGLRALCLGSTLPLPGGIKVSCLILVDEDTHLEGRLRC